MSRTWLLYAAVLAPTLVGAVFLVWPPAGGVAASPPAVEVAVEGNGTSPEQLVFLLQYLGTDYAVAVRDGRVISQFEYREMLDFSRILLEEYGEIRASRDSSRGEDLTPGFRRLRRLIEEKADPERVRALADRLVPRLTAQFAIAASPAMAPDLERGERIYQESCARCHGRRGGGSGPAVVDMEPEPRSFRDPRMNSLAPHQLYNAVSFGVDGTAMPSFRDGLDRQRIWDVAFYVMTLRQDFDPRRPPEAVDVTLRELSTHTNRELVDERGDEGVTLAGIDYLRRHPPGPSPTELVARAERDLDDSLEAQRRGDRQRAVDLALSAYLQGIEPIEPILGQLDRGLTRELEREFGAYRASLTSGGSSAEVARRLGRLRDAIDRARTALAAPDASWGLALVQSAAIILREGIEAALLIGLMVTYLVAAGYRRLLRHAVGGAVAGVVAGLVTWIVADSLLSITPLQQEALEGITSLLAAAVLFSVSLWVIHHADVERWKRYIRARAEEALGAGSGWVLASAAFLAVYREAFETVLFYQALWLRSADARTAVVAGFVGGSVVLAGIIVAMFKFGVRIPMRPFFAITGLVLGLLCLVFAGYGVRELQNIGWFKETPIEWLPSIPVLEVWPTLESTALQCGILASFLVGWWLARSVQASEGALGGGVEAGSG